MTRELATPDPDSRESYREPEARKAPMIDPWISEQVFALYDGKRMTKQDERDARHLAAQWQMIFEEKVSREQLIACTRAVVTMLGELHKVIKGKCPECGK